MAIEGELVLTTTTSGRAGLRQQLGAGASRTCPLVAAAGAAAFGLVHLYWLVGGTLALPEGESLYSLGPDRSPSWPLLVVDVVAIPVSAAAVLLALGMAHVGPARRIGPRRRGWIAAVVAVLCVGHAAPSVPDWFLLGTGSTATSELTEMEWLVTVVYEPVFFAGGLVFALAAWLQLRRP